MSRDGLIALVFHEKGDKDNIALSILKLDDDNKIGGYTKKLGWLWIEK